MPGMTTTEVAALAGVTRFTVEREIKRGNLEAEMVGRIYVVQPGEARRWAAGFQRHAGLRKPRD